MIWVKSKVDCKRFIFLYVSVCVWEFIK
jgi:hypothetical protein